MTVREWREVTNQNTDANSFGKVQNQSLTVLARHTSDQPVAGGAAKSKELDKKILDTWIDVVGMANVRKFGTNALEADWIATRTALFYVTPNAESVIPYPWSSIVAISVLKQRTLSSELSITLKDGKKPIKLKTGRTSGDRLLELWKISKGT